MKVLTSLQIKTAEKTAVQSGLFSYADMMKNAGYAAVDEISKKFDVAGKKVLIIIGTGNNGGDGLVVASKLNCLGADVSLYCPFGMPETITASGFIKDVKNIPVQSNISGDFDFYIDALFGIGFNRQLSADAEELINLINSKSGKKIAIDIPSGVFCDGGIAQTAFKADFTITFIGYKLCHLLPPASNYCGEVALKTLDIDLKNNYSYRIINKPTAKVYEKNSHKGTFGTALLICGSYGMCGAQILAAKAAAIGGAGIVKSIVCDKNYAAFTASVPEAVTIPVETSQSGTPIIYDKTMFSALSGASAVLLGCGIGRTDEAVRLVKKAFEYTKVPLVLDADGINAVSDDISILRRAKAPLIITPHPGEMARLIGTTVSDIENNRISFAKKFACDNQCVLVLKGANTIVAAPNGEVYFNTTGNYGMAKGGSGDVLSGIIVALLSNGYDIVEAAKIAVYVHGSAGDIASKKFTKRTMLPSDILKELKHISF